MSYNFCIRIFYDQTYFKICFKNPWLTFDLDKKNLATGRFERLLTHHDYKDGLKLNWNYSEVECLF